jgi:hypothetical protein
MRSAAFREAGKRRYSTICFLRLWTKRDHLALFGQPSRNKKERNRREIA